ncbi:MAG: hypothetical protein HGA54_01710 [Actinobacteria bacterium]|nr:hypothetical protein [Actinomycetota bacterium]
MKMDLDLDGLDAAIIALRNAQPNIKKSTAPVMEAYAKEISTKSSAFASDHRHPSGLFSGARGRRLPAAPYLITQRGPFYWTVSTPGGQWGKAVAMAEFASFGYDPKGENFVKQLTKEYGRAGGSGHGRILYATGDATYNAFMARMGAAIKTAEAETQKEMEA